MAPIFSAAVDSKIRSPPGTISHVVSHQVGDHRRIARIVFRNAGLHFAHCSRDVQVSVRQPTFVSTITDWNCVCPKFGRNSNFFYQICDAIAGYARENSSIFMA
jgi:hypothetical protein